MESLTSDQRKFLIKLYKNTLPGAVVSLISKREEITYEELTKFLEQNYHRFRTPVGGKYKGKDFQKVIKALLHDPIFKATSTGIHINVTNIQTSLKKAFKDTKLQGILYHRKKLKHAFKLSDHLSSGKSTEKIFMLETFCTQLNKDPDFCTIFENPFKVFPTQKIKQGDSYEDAAAKIGCERLIGMIQGYEITTTYFQELDKGPIVKRYQTGKVSRYLNIIERRLDRLEKLREAFSDRTHSRDFEINSL